MANRWVSAAGGLIGGQVAGRLIGIFLSSSAGESLLEKIDGRSLTPLEHRVLARKWSGNIGKALSAAITTIVLARGEDTPRRGALVNAVRQRISGGGGPLERDTDWVQVMQRVAEVMMSGGAIFRVFGEYLEDRQKASAETQRATAKRLA